MAKKNTPPWESAWTRLEKLGSGGQGTVYLVENRIGTRGVLKVLNKKNDAERRARMVQEVKALLSLQHLQIPDVLDHNMEDEPSGVELFTVLKYYAYPTL